MLTKKNDYKISGDKLQWLILKQMGKASYFSHQWHEARVNNNNDRAELFRRMLSIEQAKIWALMEIQGFKDNGEFIMVSEYIIDAIALSK